MLPDHDGRFKASIADCGVAETGPNKLLTFTCLYELTQEFTDEEWYDLHDPYHITGYHYLEKRDGSLNQSTIDQLKRAVGWDGRDPFWLQDSRLAGKIVQLTISLDTYGNKTRPKVQWLDSEDATPMQGIAKADPNARRTIQNRLGAKFRANAGGTPAPAPMPASNPAPAPPRTEAPASPAPSAMNGAWIRFSNMFPEHSTTTQIEAEWWRLLREDYADRDPKSLTADEWTAWLSGIGDRIIPF